MNATPPMEEYHPRQDSCPKCGSSHIIPRRQILTSSGEPTYSPTIRLHEKTGTPWGKIHDYPLVARVCGTCGYTEWFVAKPQELYSVYQRIKQTRLSQGQSLEEDEGNFENKIFIILAGILAVLFLIGLVAITVVFIFLRRG